MRTFLNMKIMTDGSRIGMVFACRHHSGKHSLMADAHPKPTFLWVQHTGGFISLRMFHVEQSTLYNITNPSKPCHPWPTAYYLEGIGWSIQDLILVSHNIREKRTHTVSQHNPINNTTNTPCQWFMHNHCICTCGVCPVGVHTLRCSGQPLSVGNCV